MTQTGRETKHGKTPDFPYAIHFVDVICCRKIDQCVLHKCNINKEACNNYELPRTYLAYHLNGASINMDGIFDDQAWLEVPWTNSFVGMSFSNILSIVHVVTTCSCISYLLYDLDNKWHHSLHIAATSLGILTRFARPVRIF